MNCIYTDSLSAQQQGVGSCCCVPSCCRGVPPPRRLHLASDSSAGGGLGSPAAAPLDSSGSSVGGLAAKAKAVLPSKNCEKCESGPQCEWWARVGSVAGAEKYGTQYFALCIAIKVRRLFRATHGCP